MKIPMLPQHEAYNAININMLKGGEGLTEVKLNLAELQSIHSIQSQSQPIHVFNYN